jgi:hypothetical protein
MLDRMFEPEASGESMSGNGGFGVRSADGREAGVMLAVRWHARGDVRVEEVPAPLITDRIPLGAAVSGGLTLLRDEPGRHLKILVRPGDAR